MILYFYMRRMWEVLFTILSYNAMLMRSNHINYFRMSTQTSLPKCKECMYFLHENVNTGTKHQCRRLGIQNNSTKEIEYGSAEQERSRAGRCGPEGIYFNYRHKRYR